MIKFFRKIRQKMLSENKFSKYLIYAMGEIVLVVIGILLALQINTWHENKRNRDSAFYYYNLSLQIRDSIDHRLGMTLIRSEIADLLFSEGRYDEALQHADQSVNILESGNFARSYYDIFWLRSKILEKKGDYKKALGDYKTYKYYSDSLRSDRNTKNIVQQTMRYEYNKKLLADSLEYAKNEAIKDLEIARRDANLLTQRIALATASGGILLLVLLAISIRRGKKRSDELLLNILPYEVAEELKKKGEAEARLIDNATIMLTDFKDFTSLSEKLSPKELVVDIHAAFTGFDKIMERHGLEKIKTIGDAYMAAGGLPVPNNSHAFDVVNAALDIRDFIRNGKQKKIEQGLPYFEIRIGVHTGPVVAGIVGIKKFSYDIWGDTVNTAARLESSGKEGHVNISNETYKLLKDIDGFEFTPRGQIETKGKGMVKMWFVDRKE
jgi:adenylate cyclase